MQEIKLQQNNKLCLYLSFQPLLQLCCVKKRPQVQLLKEAKYISNSQICWSAVSVGPDCIPALQAAKWFRYVQKDLILGPLLKEQWSPMTSFFQGDPCSSWPQEDNRIFFVAFPTLCLLTFHPPKWFTWPRQLSVWWGSRFQQKLEETSKWHGKECELD
jgi:hypothetical protein